jgi:adenylate kinase family enzyme
MKVVLLGNAGAGKSTLAKRLMQREPAARLSLDEVAFGAGTDRRPLEDSVADVLVFIAANDSWIIEGCYSDILEPVLGHCEELYFLNPGIETCVAHCRARPWEPEKYITPEAQDRNIDNLIAWVRAYEARDDEYGLKRHRALFAAFNGNKREFKDPVGYLSV